MELFDSPSSGRSAGSSSLQLLRLKDIYWDPRRETRPSRFVRTFVGSTGSATSVACNDDGTRVVVAGAQSLKIIRAQDADTPASVPPPSRSAKLLATGRGSAQLFEELNMWGSARPTENFLMNDVSWGVGGFSNKIVTACSSGDIVLWDLHKSSSKIERVFRKEHKRAVTCALFAPLMPGLFMTGSQDSTVRLFDLRTKGKTRSFNHSTTVRSVAFSPFQPSSTSPVNDILVATEGGDVLRWDIRSPDKMLGRLAAAHKGAILGMDWVMDDDVGGGGSSRSWMCTGGVDRAVKVWEMSPIGMPSEPRHVLRTPHPVKHVMWRPSARVSALSTSSSHHPHHLTELLIVPRTVGVSPFGLRGSGSMKESSENSTTSSAVIPANSSAATVTGAGATKDDLADMDKDRPGIWDVRRHYVPKYVLLGGEGAVADAVWTSADTICTVYRNGSFVRHDIAHSYAPLHHTTSDPPDPYFSSDVVPSIPIANARSRWERERERERSPSVLRSGSINQTSVDWDPMGGVAFVTAPASKTIGEVPFDDVRPGISHLLSLPSKTPSEAPFESQQVAAHAAGPIGGSAGSHLPALGDLNVLRQLARQYRFHVTHDLMARQLCEHNAEVAMSVGDLPAAQLWDRLGSLMPTESTSTIAETGTSLEPLSGPAIADGSLAPRTPPSAGFQHLPSVSPEIPEQSLLANQSIPAPGRSTESRSRATSALRRTPSTSMMRSFVFGAAGGETGGSSTTTTRSHLDRVTSQTPTAGAGSPASLRSPAPLPSLSLSSSRVSSPVAPLAPLTVVPRRAHQRAASAAAATVSGVPSTSQRPHSPAPPRTTASRSLSRLGRRTSGPRTSFGAASDADSHLPPGSPSPFVHHTHQAGTSRTSSRSSSTDASVFRQYSDQPPSSAHSDQPLISHHETSPPFARSVRRLSSRSPSISSRPGTTRDRTVSRSTAGGSSGLRTRSHSITSTTALFALQDDISESSEGLMDDFHDRDSPGGANGVSRPPSPSTAGVPIAPSPLSKTLVASGSPELQTRHLIREGLARVEEVVEPSSFRSVVTVMAEQRPPSTPHAHLDSSFFAGNRSRSRSQSHSRRRPYLPSSEGSFASDDAIDADDNWDPTSDAEEDMYENSPRPDRFQPGFIPLDFSHLMSNDHAGEGDTDEDPYLARQFSETSIRTAVPFPRDVSEAMYGPFRAQRANGTSSLSRNRSRRASLIGGRLPSSRSHSKSKSRTHSRSASRPRMGSRQNSHTKSDKAADPVTPGPAPADTLTPAQSHRRFSNISQSHMNDAHGVIIKAGVDSQAHEGRAGEEERGRSRRRKLSLVVEAQERVREIAWTTLRERVEEEVEAGNVQLASLLVVIGGENLMKEARRREALAESYAGLLDRLRLHSSAALLRKSTALRSLNEPTMIDTTIYTSCGSCHKALTGPPLATRETRVGGTYQLCSNCRTNNARCAICHLPARGLHLFCQGCSHGGHQECMRAYISARAPAQRRAPRIDPPPSTPDGGTGASTSSTLPRTRSFAFGGFSSRTSSMFGPSAAVSSLIDIQHHIAKEGTSPLSTTGLGRSPPSEDRSDGAGLPKSWISNTSAMPVPFTELKDVKYYLCPSGCGHYCWAANSPTPGTAST